MEGRIVKYGQVSPERAKVWTERSAKYVQKRKVPVVYYLCRNRQLEHPHFIEVPVSSPEGLYLRDVIEKLNALRGRGMASMYSWSCKRSYKNGFVWHDLCQDDLITPAHGNEYVLKGSEVVEESNSGHPSPAANFMIQNIKQSPEPPRSRSQDDMFSSSSMHGKDTKHHQEDEVSPSSRCSESSGISLDSRVGNSSPWAGPLSLNEYVASTNGAAANASTQTEEENGKHQVGDTCIRGVSTDDGSIDTGLPGDCQNHTQRIKQDPQNCRNSLSPPSSSSASSSVGKTETLESLIKTDASRINSFRIVEGDNVRVAANPKLKASNMLMQLISCGSLSVKDHSFGLVPSYRPQFSRLQFPSPLHSASVMLGELDYLPENRRLMGLKPEDKEYFSGSLVETKTPKEGDSHISFKRSSSFNTDRSSNQPELGDDTSSTPSKCLPVSIKASIGKHPRSESMRFPNSDKARISSDGYDEPCIPARDVPNAESKRITAASSPGNISSRGSDFLREEKEKIFTIEESLLQELGL